MKQLIFRFSVLLALMTGLLWSSEANAGQKRAALTYQQQIVTGHVTDASGNGLSGVSVEIKGTTRGVVTDATGHFSIEAKNGAVLVFSYTGYSSQQVTVNGRGPIKVTLSEKLSELNEVVVIGYGTQKKSLVTGAISKVTSEAIANKQITRFDDALRGQAAGVLVTQSSGAPGAGPTVRIRGTTTLNNSDPLYVVDGVVMNGGIDYLNPNDIASIEVLKDAASGAVYGTQAANGVIIVTTKKGAMNSPMRINYNGQMGWQGPINKVKLTNATQYAQLRNEAYINDGKAVPYPSPSIYGSGTNWQNELFSNNALYQNHDINISGGSDKSTYFLSAGYIGQQGIIDPAVAYSNSFSLTANTSFKISKYVQVGENLSYTYRKSNTGMGTNTEFGGPLSSALNLDPVTPVYVDSAFVAANSGTYPYPQYLVRNGSRYYAISPIVGQEMTNPLAWAQTQQGNYNWSHNLVGNAYINISPVKGLNLRSQISAKKGFWGYEGFTPLYYLNANNSNTNQVAQIRNTQQNLTWNWDNTISYDKQIGLHSFTLMAGTSAMKQNGQGAYITYNGEPVTNYQDASFNYNLPVNQRIGSASDDQPYALNSYFGRITYNYDERYLFMGILRHDGSTKFGSNNRWANFPSAQFGWVVTREKFFPKNTPIDNLKLRISYGVVGNDMSLSPFQYESVISGGGNKNYVFGSNQLLIGYSPSAPANPNLKWEQTASLDAGFDAVVFHHFTVAFDYYNKKTTGILQQVQIPGFAGYAAQPWANVGDMVNKGAELELGYKNTIGKDFHFGLNGNISYNDNSVTYLGNGVAYLNGGSTFQTSTYPLTRTAVGHPIGAFYGFEELGTFKTQEEINSYGYTDASGKFQPYQPNAKPGDFKWWKNPNNPDDGGKGVIGQGDRTWIGDPTAHWFYGVTVNLQYKNWDFLAFGQGVWGNQIFQAYRRLDIANANYPVEALDAWTTLNPNSNYPRLTDADANHNFGNPSNFYLQNGAYFRLKTLQIGYSLPEAWMNVVRLQRVRIYGSVSNLFTLTKYTGYDPEVGGSSYGIDRGIYPQARTYIVGLNLGF